MIKQDNNVWENKTITADKEPARQAAPAASSIDIDIRRILSVWPFVILFALLGFAAGNIYLRYVDTIYYVSTSISMEQKEEVSIGQAVFGSARDPFNDKIAYFKSPTLASQLVTSLGLQYHAVAKGRFKDKDFYGLIKWSILPNQTGNIPLLNFIITPNENGFHFKADAEEGNAKWGEPFTIKSSRVLVTKLNPFSGQSPITCYNINDLSAAFELSRGITIASNKESNIINISYADISSERAIDILNGLTELYNHVLEQNKSQSFSQAIDFIEHRLGPLGKELDSIETAMAHYKSSKGFIGTSANGGIYLDKIKEYDKQLNDINILKSTIEAVERFIVNPNLKETDLAFVGINDPNLQNTLIQYQQMKKDRDKLAMVATDNNPTLQLADQHLTDLKSNMNSQLQNYKNNLKLTEMNYQQNMRTADVMLRNTPNEEKELIDKTRLQNIKESLFLTLLQKREEASIAKASVTVDTKILFPPVKSNAIQKPSRSKILTGAILIGLLFPIVFALIKELLNKKIVSRKQLEKITNIPVIGELEETETMTEMPFVIEKSKRSMFGEQIRSLRTNLNFYRTPEKKCNYILITSTVSGEGKSFLSLNLGRSYSLQGKKVALLEFDLRRPKMSKALEVPKDHPGLTSVLIGKSEPSSIVFSALKDANEKLDFFPAGAIPPNPQELISGIYMKKIKDYLDENYEIVIIDTPPFGIVADAQILGEWADVTLVLTRFQQTIGEQVQDINKWHERGVFKSMAIVFNGVKNKGYFGNKYGNYYYKRKYGYSYYSPINGNGDSEK